MLMDWLLLGVGEEKVRLGYIIWGRCDEWQTLSLEDRWAWEGTWGRNVYRGRERGEVELRRGAPGVEIWIICVGIHRATCIGGMFGAVLALAGVVSFLLLFFVWSRLLRSREGGLLRAGIGKGMVAFVCVYPRREGMIDSSHVCRSASEFDDPVKERGMSEENVLDCERLGPRML